MFDPFYWYERELDNDYLAYINGFDDYNDYVQKLEVKNERILSSNERI